MKQLSGFTLIELAIVLIILGLLAGGVLYGQNLIRAAELRAIASEHEKFVAATSTFRGKYFYLPGDMPNAEDFWGVFSAGGGCPAGSGVGTETCNGNGDGMVFAGVADEAGEPFTYWQHLANAGLIEGRYTGINGSDSTRDAELDVNVPRSKVSNAGWTFHLFGGGGANDYTFTDELGHIFRFGVDSDTWSTEDPALTPEEAWNIDSKIDDGLPTYGAVRARFWNNQCGAANDGTHTAADLDASYNLDDTDIECALFFVEGL